MMIIVNKVKKKIGTSKMKKTVMTKWVNELRSDRYKQGTGFLKQKDENGTLKHCCLGVLCELYNSEMKKNKKKQLNEVEEYHPDLCDLGDDSVAYKFNEQDAMLPYAVVEWSDLDSPEVAFKHYDNFGLPLPYNSLVDMNDGEVPFETIANVIEKEWETL